MNEFQGMVRAASLSIVWAVLASTAAAASSIGLMGISAWLVASAALQPPLYTLSLAILGVRCCGIMRAVLRYLERYLTHRAGFGIFNDFRLYVLRRVTDALPFRVRTSGGDAFDIIVTAVDTLRDSVLRFALPPAAAFLTAAAAALWLSFYSPALAIIMIAAWLAFGLALPLAAGKMLQRQESGHLNLAQDVMEIYEGSTELEVYGWAGRRIDAAGASVDAYQSRRQAESACKSRIRTASEILSVLFLCIVICVLAQLTARQELSGVAAVCIALTVQAVLEMLASLPELAFHVHEAAQSRQQLRPFLSTAQKMDAAADIFCPDKTAQLCAVNLSCGYGAQPICRNMTFSLSKGRRTLLLGASGSGKSTLLYALTGLLPARTGGVFIGGVPCSSLSQEDVRSHFAASFQAHHVFNMTLRDNFKMLCDDLSDAEIAEALSRTGLSDLSLDFMLESDALNLSGGQRRRLQLAMCTARPKDIILLDEPTAGLDILAARRFLAQIGRSSRGAAMLVTSHDLSIVDFFDDVIIMQNGRIAEQGSVKNLLKNKNSLLFKQIAYDNLL